MGRIWSTPEKLEDLTYELVNWNSITGSTGEGEFPYKLKDLILRIPYFEKQPELVKLHAAQTGRQSLSALYKCNQSHVKNTIVFISHFDTVDTDDYGELEPLALDPLALKAKLRQDAFHEKDELKHDILSDVYVFGRGIMDMKSGLAQHIHVLEQACDEDWPVNLLLLTVHDEEADSEGIRTMIPSLNQLAEQYDLNYRLVLNGEPSFPEYEKDEAQYIYSGSMGKIMPTVVVRGKGTHAGDSHRAVSAPYILSYITQAMEWNTVFSDSFQGEASALPATLSSRDLKSHYSVQIPVTAYSMYNVLMLNSGPDEIMERFTNVVTKALYQCSKTLKNNKDIQLSKTEKDIRVMTYEELNRYVREQHSNDWIDAKINEYSSHPAWDEREQSIRITEMLLNSCPEIGPVAICLFAPPYYPAVNSSTEPLVIRLIDAVRKKANTISREIEHRHYFNGISDLSYVNKAKVDLHAEIISNNMPVWGRGYKIPFVEMAQLSAPVMNIGSYGKDPHLRSERLHKISAFKETPELIKTVIFEIMNEKQEDV